MSANEVRTPKKSGFVGFFGFLLELCIVGGALMWVAYGYLPHQYYLPVSFAAVLVIGVVSYYVLNKRLDL